jgi:predicted dehydrogenase
MTRLPEALPHSRVPNPQNAPPIRWGILGPGWIAERFAYAIHRLTRSRVVAVGSRRLDTAERFAVTHRIERAYGSYAAVLEDADVDVVYVATPHNAHFLHASQAMAAGKHVLVEKPLALNANQAAELGGIAAAQRVFCMEALWTLFLPKFDVVRQLLDTHALGRVHTVIADHGEFFRPEHRIMRHDLAGGPLLDLGTYPVALAHWVLGPPASVFAAGEPAASGVNGQTAAVLGYAGGAQALLHTTLFSNTPTTMTIAGDGGTLVMDGPFFRPGRFTLESPDRSQSRTFSEPDTGYDGLAYEIAEVARAVTASETGSPIRPLEDTVATLAVIDEIRRQIGVTFNEEI